jgi:alcohol dehydrogenase class IV
MCFACLVAGMSFTDAKTHFGHAFGHSLGARYHIPHGTGCAIAQPGVIAIAADLMPEKVRRVGELMGLTLSDNLSSAELGKLVSERIAAFNKEIGVPTLKQLNIKESDFVPLAEGLMKDVCFSFMPVKLGMQDVLKVIQGLYAL